MKNLDNRYYNEVIAEMQPFFEEQGFKASNDGAFANEKYAVRVEYDEPKQMYLLKTAEITDGSIGEFADSSSWLFDDSQNAKDAAAVGIDFTETLRSMLGVKVKRAAGNASAVDLPTAKKGAALNISGFTKRVLDVFPQFKDGYKEHVAKYGNFLYMDFFADTLAPQIKEILKDGNKKQIKKLFELMEDGYLKGDRETVNLVVAVIAAAVCDDAALKTAADSMLESDTHMRSSVQNLIPVIAKNGKLRSALIK